MDRGNLSADGIYVWTEADQNATFLVKSWILGVKIHA